MNKRDEIPLTEDLVKLSQVLKDDLAQLTNEVEHDPTPKNGRALAEAVLCYLVLFNKRRGGEMSKLLYETFNEATSSQESIVNEEILKSLSKLEEQLAKRMTLINTKGKRGRHVPGIR